MDQDAILYGKVGLGPGHIVLDGNPARPIPRRGTAASQFSVLVYCGQTAGWTKMPLGTEVGLGPGDIVLGGDPAPAPSPLPRGAQQRPHFSANLYCGPTAAHLSKC